MPREAFLEEAVAIGDRLANEAVHDRGRCNWLTRHPLLPASVAPGGPSAVEPLDASVYTGTAGVALFLGRLASMSGQRAHRLAALAAIRHALRHAWDLRDRPLLRTGAEWRFSFYAGALGVAWVASELSGLLGEARLAQEGRRLFRALQRARAGPNEVDIMLGSASGIAALLDLHRRGTEGALDLAASLGDSLVDNACPAPGGRCWPSLALRTGAAPGPTGFSHGAAGVAWALTKLHDATRGPRYLEAAEAGFAYERHHFDPRVRNWPNFLSGPGADGVYPCWSTWCHGAPGIGASRADAHRRLRDPRLREEVIMARGTTEAHLRHLLERPGSNFMPCCGVAGVAECLWLMDEALGTPGALDLQRRIGLYGIERFGAAARKKWGPTIEWPTGVPWGVYPPLMKGLAGVGHYLLRLHAPDKVPTVLLPGQGCPR